MFRRIVIIAVILVLFSSFSFLRVSQSNEHYDYQTMYATPNPLGDTSAQASSLNLLEDFSVLFAIIASVFLMASELSSADYGKINKRLNKALLQKIAIVVTILFAATMVVRIASILV